VRHIVWERVRDRALGWMEKNETLQKHEEKSQGSGWKVWRELSCLKTSWGGGTGKIKNRQQVRHRDTLL
jgi:hypothetical protein